MSVAWSEDPVAPPDVGPSSITLYCAHPVTRDYESAVAGEVDRAVRVWLLEDGVAAAAAIARRFFSRCYGQGALE